MTAGQNRRLHQLLNILELTNYKKELVHSFSGGRTESSKGLNANEARELIAHLERSEKELAELSKKEDQLAKPGEKMRKKIFSLCWQMKFCKEENTKEQNNAIVKGLVEKLGVLKPKPLNQYSEQELPRLVTQFEQMRFNNLLQEARVLVRNEFAFMNGAESQSDFKGYLK